MKTLKNLSLILLTMGLLYSCSQKSKPENAAISFQTAFMKLDFDKAGEFGTDKTKEFMKTMKGFATMMGEEKYKEEKAKAEKSKIEVLSCICVEIEKDKQRCDLSMKNEEGKNDSTQLTLVKVNDKWLVDMSKEDAGMNSKENSEDENGIENPEDFNNLDGIYEDSSNAVDSGIDYE